MSRKLAMVRALQAAVDAIRPTGRRNPREVRALQFCAVPLASPGQMIPRRWSAEFNALPPPTCAASQRLIEASQQFAFDPLAQCAIDAGWSDGDLFARDEGLVPLALARGARIVAVTGEAAELHAGCISESFPRPATDAPPWWNDPRAVGEV